MIDAPAPPREVIRAQPGPQEVALSSDADVVIFGGAAGGGKSFAALLGVVQYAHLPQFGAEVFRRTYPELTATGGLWPESFKIFPHVGGEAREGDLRWRFPSGASAKFSHMQHASDRFKWKGAQLPHAAFDQIETFEEEQFWYIVSRMRDPSGTVSPWIFGTCNPVPDDDPIGAWLHRIVCSWWVDAKSGEPIEARSGSVRWVVRDGDDLRWTSARGEAEVAARRVGGAARPLSFTFIRSRLEDNPALLAADPGYPGRIALLPRVERIRLGGNWAIRAAAGLVFNRAWFEVVAAAPVEARRIRYWDKAATPDGGDWSAGVRIARAGGLYFVEDVVRGQWSPADRNRVMKQVADADGPEVKIRVEQEPGSGGKESAMITVQQIQGRDVRADRPVTNLHARTGPMSAQAEAGNVKLVAGAWVEPFLREYHGFTGAAGATDDQVAAGVGAFNLLALERGAPDITVGAGERSAEASGVEAEVVG